MSNPMDSITMVDEIYTVNIKITNQERAQQLACTMYQQEMIEDFGVEVMSWGVGDLQKAADNRIELMSEENERHYQAMWNIQNMDVRELMK
jgi:hypothetical protein